jgi:hypothetical protein
MLESMAHPGDVRGATEVVDQGNHAAGTRRHQAAKAVPVIFIVCQEEDRVVVAVGHCGFGADDGMVLEVLDCVIGC